MCSGGCELSTGSSEERHRKRDRASPQIGSRDELQFVVAPIAAPGTNKPAGPDTTRRDFVMQSDKTIETEPDKTPDLPMHVSRRNVLRSASLLAGGAALFAGALATAAAQSGKMSQQAAAYQSAPKNGQKCMDCSLFQSPSSCKLVDGTISPAGWCKFFAKKAS
jgi:hypothetical protein